jgi:hypothetical protein
MVNWTDMIGSSTTRRAFFAASLKHEAKYYLGIVAYAADPADISGFRFRTCSDGFEVADTEHSRQHWNAVIVSCDRQQSS